MRRKLRLVLMSVEQRDAEASLVPRPESHVGTRDTRTSTGLGHCHTHIISDRSHVTPGDSKIEAFWPLLLPLQQTVASLSVSLV